MSISDPKVVDIISRSPDGTVTLTVSDHLDWEDTAGHLRLLQDKLNVYLAFVESGEIFTSYPGAKRAPIAFEVVMMHEPNELARQFLERAGTVIHEAGFRFTHRVWAPSQA